LGGGGGGLGGGGGQQSVGGGGGGGRGGRGGGGGGGGFRGGGGGGGRGRGGFDIPPEKVVRVDVPLVCLDHGLREPSDSKPYAIAPIENFISDPAVIEIVSAYANGEVSTGAAQAAVWNLNSGVGWDELAAKLTGTVRSAVRDPYFSRDEIQTAMSVVQQARTSTAGQKVKPRPFKLPGEVKIAKGAEPEPADGSSPGDVVSPAKAKAASDTKDAPAAKASDASADVSK
jgi:hypothetical protein